MVGGFEGVLFDIGGVLENTPATNWKDSWCRRLDLSLDEFTSRLRPIVMPGMTGEASLDQVHAGVMRELGFEQADLEAFMEDLWEEYLGTPNSDLIDYFVTLNSRFATGILSNSFVGARERERERYGFEAMCDVLVYSHEEGMSKPDPEIYRLACQRLGVDPDRTVFVDDTEEMLIGAAAVGLTPVKFVGQQETIDAIERVLDGSSDGWKRSTAGGGGSAARSVSEDPTGGLRH